MTPQTWTRTERRRAIVADGTEETAKRIMALCSYRTDHHAPLYEPGWVFWVDAMDRDGWDTGDELRAEGWELSEDEGEQV